MSVVVPTAPDQDTTLYGLYYCELSRSTGPVILRQISESGLSQICYRFHFTLYGAVHLYDNTIWGQRQFLFCDSALVQIVSSKQEYLTVENL